MTTLIPKYDQGSSGAANRPFNLKLAESISVLDFGADNTGANDSSTAFINAIASLPSTGGTIYVPNGTYLINSTINVSKSIYFSLGAVTINFTVNPGINHTSGDLSIHGVGQTSSILTSNSNGDLIYSTAAAGTASTGLYKLSIENIRLKDLLTTQSGTTFSTWSTTRTAGAGINIQGTTFNLKNIYAFGFFDSYHIAQSVTSTIESCISFWSAQHSFFIGYNCTSLILTGTYSFAPQQHGYHLEDNCNYMTFNSTACDSSGVVGYYLGPGVHYGLSPYNITFNSIGCEQPGSRVTTGSAIQLDGVRNILFNEPFIVGIPQSSLTNTVNGITTSNVSGSKNAFITVNGGIIGTALSSATLGGYSFNFPTGTTAGSSIIILTNPSETNALLGVNDPDGALVYQAGLSLTYASAPSGTSVNLNTFSSALPAASYIITTSVNLGTASAWTTVDLVAIEVTSSTITHLKTATGITTAMTGDVFSATQSSGSAATITCKILRVG